MSIIIDKNGHLVQTSESPVDAECVVQRMRALIGILQKVEDHNCVHYHYENHLVLEMLREQLPTPEQAALYLKQSIE